MGDEDDRSKRWWFQRSAPPVAPESAPGPVPPARDDRYRHLGTLGEGGSARVTAAWDRSLRRRVARKTIRENRSRTRALLLHEARLLAWLDHAGAVPVYDVDVSVSGASYTMRLLDGRTLRERLDAEGPLPVEEAIRILTRLGETMANAHAKGVLHLDLKPGNVILLPHGQVCVIDWGVARFHDLVQYETFLRQAGVTETPDAAGFRGIAGTPEYMPAEQAKGAALTPATDIYAAGAMLYEMLVGALPVATPGATVVPPRAHRADLPARLEALCLRMLSPAPADRPPDFDTVLADLRDLHSVVLGATFALRPGDVLFREGERGRDAYQILDGEVVVTVEGPQGTAEVARRGVGDVVGELAVVLDGPRTATVTAVTRTTVAIVSASVLEEALDGAHPLLAQVLRGMSERLREEADRAKRG